MSLALNDLLSIAGVEPAKTLVMYHRPDERRLTEALPFIAAERPELLDAYQSYHSARVEASLSKAQHLVSCINPGDGTVIFVSVLRQSGWTERPWGEIRRQPALLELANLGHGEKNDDEKVYRQFTLDPHPALAELKGRLILTRPSGRGYTRWAVSTSFEVVAIERESRLTDQLPPWDELVLGWSQLAVLPSVWKVRLGEWRGIYLITDMSDGKQYVGAAYGTENLLGRWQTYLRSGHGGNRDLRSRRPEDFRFSILQRVSPDLEPEAVQALEASWKTRLQTRELGLNRN